MTIQPPTILGTRTIPGMHQSNAPGGLSWNDDGQAAFYTTRGVHILTPHLICSLPAPPAYLAPGLTLEHPSMILGRYRRGEMPADNEEDEAGPSTRPVRRVRRPKNGEVGWYLNGVDPKEIDRMEVYGWTEVGEESSAIISHDEFTAQAMAWSPSGLSDLGSCLLAIMTTQGQVSVYVPSRDPYTKRWEEIADMTVLTRATLKKEKELTVPMMLQMRATCMQWSHALPLTSTLGIDSSLFAIANRAGKVVFWSYGPERRFEKVLGAEVTTGWIIALDWSAWVEVDKNTCTSRLAMACSDGSVAILHIQQTVQVDAEGAISRTVKVVKDEKMPDQDMRAICGLRWIGTILVVTRPGSITFWSASFSGLVKWSGCKRIVLPGLGNWAGANPLSSCAAIQQIDSDSLLIVLSTHIQYIITDLLTSPRLDDHADSLNLSIAARQVYLDHVQTDMFEGADSTKQDAYVQSTTALTCGWAGVGEAGLVSWCGEATNFANMEMKPEGIRQSTFVVADMGGIVPRRRAVMDEIEDVLESPPSLVQISPLKALLPQLLRIVAMPDQDSIGSEILELLSSEAWNEAGPATSSLDDRGASSKDAMAKLRLSIWGSKALDGMRLRYALARWSAATFTSSAKAFTSISTSILQAIQGIVVERQLAWAAKSCGKSIGIDLPFLRLLLRYTTDSNVASDIDALSRAVSHLGADAGDALLDPCPACAQPVALGDVNGNARCGKGHEWSRCSVTRLLIAQPNYRVCSSCPAVSLIPTSSAEPPIPVAEDGSDTDYLRVAGKAESGGMAEQMLEAAVVCLLCGGRWVRVY